MKYSLFFELIAGHAVADYGLQSAYMASEKRRNVCVMAAHALIHGAMVLYVLQQRKTPYSAAIAATEAVAHAAIDVVKCRYAVPDWMDQLAHVVCKFLIVWKIGEKQ